MRDFKSAQVPEPSARWLRVRVAVVGGSFLVLLVGVFGRAVMLQVVERERLTDLATDQYVRQIEIPPRRGEIFDRRGVPLAQSVEVDSVALDPSMVPDLGKASRELARALHLDAAELASRLVRAKRFAWVKRRAKPEEVLAAKALSLPGLTFHKEPRRFYPQRELAAHVLGVVGTDGHGLDGLELAFEDALSGEASQLPSLRDARGRKLITAGLADAAEREGATVTLTIDRHVQHVAEKALAKAVEDAKATAGMAVVADPKTGELLALANYPRFNPNTPEGTAREAMRNRAALDVFEPGSTFKSFLVAAALEAGTLRLGDTYDCEKGAWKVGRHTIHDTHPYGVLTPARILQVSSNICSAKIAQVLGRERLVEAYGRFGFGERSGLALPGEGKGSVPFPKAEVALATQAFGQGLSATAVQLVAAYGALANDGVLMRPYLVSKVVDRDGAVLLENRPTQVRRAVSPKVARQVISMLELVVEKEGTAPRAQMEEYRVAGKTGTAQKVDPVARGYSDKRIASFIGVVPAEAPRAVILVVVDEPKTDVYGGLVAAPAFKEIAAAALPYLGVPPSRAVALVPASVAAGREGEMAPEVAPEGRGALAAAFARAAQDEVTEEPELGEGEVPVPDLTGEVGRRAVVRLLSASLQPRVNGSGRVVSQRPPAGSRVPKGSRVILELAARQ